MKTKSITTHLKILRHRLLGGGLIVTLCGLALTGHSSGQTGPAGELNAGDLRRSGTIHLDITCDPAVKEDFETSVALLHSFFYDEARRRFTAITRRDPGCAMAHWGVAMTWFHPLWAPPTIEERANGLAAIVKARQIGGTSELERGLIDAVFSYYTATEKPAFDGGVIAGCSCCGPLAHSARARAFHQRMAQLHRRFPEHVEVAAFYALSKLGTVDPTDKTYARQKVAGVLLERLFAENPDHPGIAHYIIHAYDYPELASRGLNAARRYDDIAPWVPHALHMPTHIYTRLGMWQDSINGNIASSEAARDHSRRFYGNAATMDDLHAMDYLMFAYLQTGRDTEAGRLLDHLAAIREIVSGNEFASAYAVAAMPARYHLERRAWEDAASMDLVQREFVERFPFAVAHAEFARAVGAARSGQPDLAREAVENLARLRDSVKDPKFLWWTGQIEIQHLAAAGWLEHAQGQPVRAEALFREAAAIEDRAGTHPITPGQVLPAREQLGEFLLETGRPEAALLEFERSLEAFPRRFHSHEGAARAAQLTGRRETARRHARELLRMAGGQGERTAVLAEMRAIVGGECSAIRNAPVPPPRPSR